MKKNTNSLIIIIIIIIVYLTTKVIWSVSPEYIRWLLLFLPPIVIALIMIRYKSPDRKKRKGVTIIVSGLVLITYLVGGFLIIQDIYPAFFKHYKTVMAIITLVAVVAFIISSMYAVSIIMESNTDQCNN